MSEIDTGTEAIAALMDGVTPGPWETGDHGRVEAYRGFSDEDQADYWEAVADVETDADQRFIAASRDLVPTLAAEIEQLRAENASLRVEVGSGTQKIADARIALLDCSVTNSELMSRNESLLATAKELRSALENALSHHHAASVIVRGQFGPSYSEMAGEMEEACRRWEIVLDRVRVRGAK